MTSRVSILVAAWNAAAYVSETILSVQSQTYESWELLIVDDGSTDNTAEIVKKYALLDERIKYYFQGNCGAHIARNFAFQKSKGEYIVILDADDRILPEKLSIQVRILDERPDYGVVYGDTWHCDHLMRRLVLESKKYPRQHVSGDIFEDMILGNRFAVHAGMVRRSVLEDVGLHSEKPNLIADWDLWCRVAEKYKFFYDPGAVAEYRIHPGMSAKKDLARKQFDQRMGTAENIRKLVRFKSYASQGVADFNFANVRFAQKFGLRNEALCLAWKMILDQPLNVRGYLLYGYSFFQIKKRHD